tara:strand:- start:17820 stop:18230 length:411 start_codon:yes stop_codon:yes gene_type:complete
MEVIMAQMRKFEQEAIVNQIIKTIKTNREKQNETLKSHKKYLAVVRINEDIKDLESKLKFLRKEKEALQDSRRELINDFNEKFNVELDYDYNDNLKFEFEKWTVRRDVEDQLAIALLGSEWKDNLPAIIEEIASQF